MKIDYSQYGQALLLEQLITDDTPHILVDIGAHDGVCGSNSRALLEEGWRGLLVEPLPQVFERLKENSASLPNVTLIQAACSDRSGSAKIRIGRDGNLGQMSSLSQDPHLLENLSDQMIEVQTATLPDLIATHNVPDDFGVLLVDTEGWDLTVLQGLERTPVRPRIIVTEEFVGTNVAKYRFLASLGYENVGLWGSDSFWIHRARKREAAEFAPPVYQLPPTWKPRGRHAGTGNSLLDTCAFFRNSIAGWAWTDLNSPPPHDIFLTLRSLTTGDKRTYAAWRSPRPDVAQIFQSPSLLLSGFRAQVDVATGDYEVTVVQQGADYFTTNCAGIVTLPH
jgi:FkbM family methyltransferase